jgi:hypothetical protein
MPSAVMPFLRHSLPASRLAPYRAWRRPWPQALAQQADSPRATSIALLAPCCPNRVRNPPRRSGIQPAPIRPGISFGGQLQRKPLEAITNFACHFTPALVTSLQPGLVK